MSSYRAAHEYRFFAAVADHGRCRNGEIIMSLRPYSSSIITKIEQRDENIEGRSLVNYINRAMRKLIGQRQKYGLA